MQIYVNKNQERLGPYSSVEARNRILTGQLSGADLAWHEGLPSWVTLSEILASQSSHPTIGPIPSTPAAASTSALAIASVVAAIIGAIGWIGLLICVVIASQHGRIKDKNDPVLLVVDLFFLLLLLVNIFGAVGGIAALMKRTRQKWIAITGLIFNALEFLVVFALMILAQLMK